MGNICQNCNNQESITLSSFKFNWPPSGQCKVISSNFKIFIPNYLAKGISVNQVEAQTQKLVEAHLKWTTQGDSLLFVYQENQAYNLQGEKLPLQCSLEFTFEVNRLTGQYMNFTGSEHELASNMLASMGVFEDTHEIDHKLLNPLYRNIKNFTKVMWDTWIDQWVQKQKEPPNRSEENYGTITIEKKLFQFDSDLLKEVDQILGEIESHSDSYMYKNWDSSLRVETMFNMHSQLPITATREAMTLVEFYPTFLYGISSKLSEKKKQNENLYYKIYKSSLWMFDWDQLPHDKLQTFIEQEVMKFNHQVMMGTKSFFNINSISLRSHISNISNM